ncbi:MAG: RNA polymerase sigma-70 factor [Parabacteroides sp.]|nr:RNA polymerase sigma-70 factor [Parabacteroides sp.]
MNIDQVGEDLIAQINSGSEHAFSELYKAYYVYLNTIAIYYLFDRNVSAEVVNDVFLNIWYKRRTLVFPVHSYLVRAVQNGCLNYIRSQRSLQTVLDEHEEQIWAFQEDCITSTPVPLQYVELKETEAEIKEAISALPPKCRRVFESYFYAGQSAEEIARDQNLTVSTVRVQIKNALDRLKLSLKHLLFILFFI